VALLCRRVRLKPDLQKSFVMMVFVGSTLVECGVGKNTYCFRIVNLLIIEYVALLYLGVRLKPDLQNYRDAGFCRFDFSRMRCG